MKRKRWTYTVYFRGKVVKTFSSRKAGHHFMKNMTELDLPFLVMPWEEGSICTMIGSLK
jgi:hypothetical protein